MTFIFYAGIVAKVFPAKKSPRYEKLCKIVLSEDLEDAAASAQSAAVINVFLLGELADEGSEICEGDRVVLSQVVSECSPTEGHSFQLIAWREKSPVSLWVISKNGKVRANTVGGVSSSSLCLSTVEKLKVSDMDLDKNGEEKSDSDFSEQTGDETHKQKGRGKKRRKFLHGSKGVTPSHAGRRVNNLVLLKECHKSKNNNPSTEEVGESVNSEGTVVNGLESIAVETSTQEMKVTKTPTRDGKGQSLRLSIKSASPTPEQPSNVQCAHIELSPSGFSTRVWNDQSTLFSGQRTDSGQFVSVDNDLPTSPASANLVPSQSTVISKQAGDNIQYMQGKMTGIMNCEKCKVATKCLDDKAVKSCQHFLRYPFFFFFSAVLPCVTLELSL